MSWPSRATVSINVPAIPPIATNPNVTRFNACYFRTVFDDDQHGRILAHHARSVLGQSHAAVVHVDATYGSTNARIFESAGFEVGLDVRHSLTLSRSASHEDLARVVDHPVGDRALQAIRLAMYPS